MEFNHLISQLAALTGYLNASSEDVENSVEKLQLSIAEAILNQNPSTVRSTEFIFERSDMFLASNIESKRLKIIEKLAETAVREEKTADTNVFIRNIPVRTTQITGSINRSSAGTRVVTVGPITDIHKIPRWFDLVNVKKLISLYIQGQSKPVILFDATFKQPKIKLPNAKPVELTSTYTLVPETVWIQAKILAGGVSDELYCGLRIKSGSITLSQNPFMSNNQITINTGTKVSCNLNLEQKENVESDASGLYGKDARNANFEIPEEFQFSFQNNSKSFTKIGSAAWDIYGQKSKFIYQNAQNSVYNAFIGRIAIPVQCENSSFEIKNCESPFFQLNGSAKIKNSWWALSVTALDITNPLEADGNGAIIIECENGLIAKWSGLQNKSVTFTNPFILGEPGRIGITDFKSDGESAFQQFDGWKDEQNVYGTTFDCRFKKNTLIIFNTIAKGDELVFGLADWDVKTDRPVKVNGEAVTVKSKDSAFILAAGKTKNWLIIIDENMLWDNKLPAEKIPKVKPYALAMHNALFTVTPPNGLVMFAELAQNFKKLVTGQLFLSFGLYSYLPALPDPYAANLGILKRQFERGNAADRTASNAQQRGSQVWLWLIGTVKWEPKDEEYDKVNVSFHFAPLTSPLHIEKETGEEQLAGRPESRHLMGGHSDFSESFSMGAVASGSMANNDNTLLMSARVRDFNPAAYYSFTDFALVDVSSKANQMGISFAGYNNLIQTSIARKYKIDISNDTNATVFPLQVSGLDVITAGMNAQAFTVPAVSWEPVFNLTNPNPAKQDPPVGFNYYQNDGVATRIGNLSKKTVPLSPIPMLKYLVQTYRDKEDGKTFAIFNLPFGMFAITILDNKSGQAQKPEIENTSPVFLNDINGGIQLELTAGTSFNSNDSDAIFEGYTFQLININKTDGSPANASTLGEDVWTMYNDEFLQNTSNLQGRPAVPVKNIGLSGYGTSMFSEWQNKNVLVGTSQAYFNVITGRTSYEVVQVKSKLYCCGADVVRTITLFRLANGYVARIDSGWESRSDGKYDFIESGNVNKFEFHPGIVRGYYNIRNIKESPKKPVVVNGATFSEVTFDADVELENVTEGGENNRVSAKSILGYVQLLPIGSYVTKEQFTTLLKTQSNSIGGPLNCMIKVAGTQQRMKINRVDVSAGVDKSNNPIFVCAARGSVVLPKDGSWTMVQHTRGTGEVAPLPEQLSVPLIRIGKWVKGQVVSNADVSNLLRIANPGDLLKLPDSDTVNFGFLQNMGTQKVLFMAPGFKKGIESVVSKTPPLMADSFRLLNSKGIFPNIGDAESSFGQAISLLKGVGAGNNPVDAFNKINLPDAGDVYDLLQLKAKEEAGKLLDQGYELAKGAVNGIADKALKFDLPSFDYPLINLDGKLIINIQYKASSKPKGQPAKNYVGKLDFDVDSFASDLTDTWKGRMNNLAMVVTIGPLTDVMTIKGNFNSQKGTETDLGSSTAPDSLPLPEIEFSDALKPVIQVLEILASLSSGEYGDALKKGLKIAMSNSANVWEYKFEANKDIPLVRFPPTKALYDSPQTPLKLEASLGIGIVFNAALKVTSDPSQLLPSAGGYFMFHGGLQVMCVSVGVGTIFAVGNADLKLEADTSPKVAVTMKFGFGAQITVGIPVVGNASVLFMVGVEVYADSSSVVKITAIMLFRGQAELLGGLVGVTITIEAKGTVEKAGAGTPTNCIAQVTFALDISIFLVIDISFSKSWQESRQIA